MSKCKFDDGVMVGLTIMFIVMTLAMLYMGTSLAPGENYYLSKTTANDICKNLTNNSIAEAGLNNQDGTLVCETPSFDHTNSIVIKNNGEKG